MDLRSLALLFETVADIDTTTTLSSLELLGGAAMQQVEVVANQGSELPPTTFNASNRAFADGRSRPPTSEAPTRKPPPSSATSMCHSSSSISSGSNNIINYKKQLLIGRSRPLSSMSTTEPHHPAGRSRPPTSEAPTRKPPPFSASNNNTTSNNTNHKQTIFGSSYSRPLSTMSMELHRPPTAVRLAQPVAVDVSSVRTARHPHSATKERRLEREATASKMRIKALFAAEKGTPLNSTAATQERAALAMTTQQPPRAVSARPRCMMDVLDKKKYKLCPPSPAACDENQRQLQVQPRHRVQQQDWDLQGIQNSHLHDINNVQHNEDVPRVRRALLLADTHAVRKSRDFKLRGSPKKGQAPASPTVCPIGRAKSAFETATDRMLQSSSSPSDECGGEPQRRRRKGLRLPSIEDTNYVLSGLHLPTSFGNPPSYWDRYHLYHTVVNKFSGSPDVTSCLGNVTREIGFVDAPKKSVVPISTPAVKNTMQGMPPAAATAVYPTRIV
eukprot:PhM_4_TR12726/c0_g1_i1/m.98135